jgi:hypothetical protein
VRATPAGRTDVRCTVRDPPGAVYEWSRGDRDRTCDLWFWRPALCQLSYAPELRRNGTAARSGTILRVQRNLLGVLFAALALGLGLIAVYSALAGGRAWVIALASAALALWMADLARRALVRWRP